MVTVTDDLTHQMRISNFRFHFCTPNVLVFTACEPIQFPFKASSNGGYRRYPVLFCNWNRGGWHFNDVRRFRSSFAYYLNGIWSIVFFVGDLVNSFFSEAGFLWKKIDSWENSGKFFLRKFNKTKNFLFPSPKILKGALRLKLSWCLRLNSKIVLTKGILLTTTKIDVSKSHVCLGEKKNKYLKANFKKNKAKAIHRFAIVSLINELNNNHENWNLSAGFCALSVPQHSEAY